MKLAWDHDLTSNATMNLTLSRRVFPGEDGGGREEYSRKGIGLEIEVGDHRECRGTDHTSRVLAKTIQSLFWTQQLHVRRFDVWPEVCLLITAGVLAKRKCTA